MIFEVESIKSAGAAWIRISDNKKPCAALSQGQADAGQKAAQNQQPILSNRLFSGTVRLGRIYPIGGVLIISVHLLSLCFRFLLPAALHPAGH